MKNYRKYSWTILDRRNFYQEKKREGKQTAKIQTPADQMRMTRCNKSPKRYNRREKERLGEAVNQFPDQQIVKASPCFDPMFRRAKDLFLSTLRIFRSMDWCGEEILWWKRRFRSFHISYIAACHPWNNARDVIFVYYSINYFAIILSIIISYQVR